MHQNLMTEPVTTEATSDAPPGQMATPLLFKLRETLPDLKWLDITHTGAPTDVPPKEIWDMDYDA